MEILQSSSLYRAADSLTGIAKASLALIGILVPAGQFQLFHFVFLIPLLLPLAMKLAGYQLTRLSERIPPAADPRDSELPSTNKSDNGLSTSAHPEICSKKILLLSNDSTDRIGINRNLDSWDIDTTLCPNAARAFAALIEAEQGDYPFDAVIVDQGRFDMNPQQFAVSVRSDPELQHLYLIHIGQLIPGTQPEQLKKAGYARLLSRPVDKTLLYNAVHDSRRTTWNTPQIVKLIDHYTGRRIRQPLSVLLAEQNPNDRRRIQTSLQQVGHQVFGVESGARVLDALDSHQFDIAIVSTHLEKVSGFEAFKLYRFTRNDQPVTPFIVLLDDASSVTDQMCKDAGVSAYLVKPIEPRKLLDTIDRVIKENVTISVGSIPQHPKTLVIDGLALDVHRLKDLERLGSGQKFLKELVRNFKQDNERLLDKMEDAAINSRSDEFKDLGHAIKDSAGSLGALALYHLGINAARMSKDDFPHTALQLTHDISICNQASYKALQHYLSEQSNQISS